MRASWGGQAAAQPEWSCEIWDENWPTWEAFLDLATNWKRETLVQGKGGAVWSESIRTGLPSPRIESTLRLRGVPRARWPAMFADLKAMERAVLLADQGRRRER